MRKFILLSVMFYAVACTCAHAQEYDITATIAGDTFTGSFEDVNGALENISITNPAWPPGGTLFTGGSSTGTNLGFVDYEGLTPAQAGSNVLLLQMQLTTPLGIGNNPQIITSSLLYSPDIGGPGTTFCVSYPGQPPAPACSSSLTDPPSSSSTTHSVPEFDFARIAVALSLLCGAALVLRGRNSNVN